MIVDSTCQPPQGTAFDVIYGRYEESNRRIITSARGSRLVTSIQGVRAFWTLMLDSWISEG